MDRLCRVPAIGPSLRLSTGSTSQLHQLLRGRPISANFGGLLSVLRRQPDRPFWDGRLQRMRKLDRRGAEPVFGDFRL
jgi:hypothetical protein